MCDPTCTVGIDQMEGDGTGTRYVVKSKKWFRGCSWKKHVHHLPRMWLTYMLTSEISDLFHIPTSMETISPHERQVDEESNMGAAQNTKMGRFDEYQTCQWHGIDLTCRGRSC